MGSGDRRPGALGGVRVPGKKKRQRKRYPSEEKRVKGTWDLPPEILEQIRLLAEELEVAQYALVEKALSDWLDAYERGDVELEKVAVATQWRLE